MINRRDFVKAAATAGVVALGNVRSEGEVKIEERSPESTARTAAPGSPNVLIFMPDQQNGATVLPGSPVIKPNMDRFLRESVAFNSAYCPAPHCCPSRTSFMTGLYPSEHGVYNNVDNNAAIHQNPFPGTEYWGNWLRDAGYAMGYSGKLHVGRDVTPETCGFETLSHLEEFSKGEAGMGDISQPAMGAPALNLPTLQPENLVKYFDLTGLICSFTERSPTKAPRAMKICLTIR